MISLPFAPIRFLYRQVAFPLLGLADAEQVHTLALDLLALAARVPGVSTSARLLRGDHDRRLAVRALGLTFPNPIGLAAGFDKNGVAVGPLLELGFGFVEVGTVTPQPQAGNPRPRLHRLPQHRAFINSLGFPNQGAARVASRLRRRQRQGIVGVNLGKGRETPLEAAVADYLVGLDHLSTLSDYVVINVSSPNTQGLRQLQARHSLAELTQAVTRRARHLAAQASIPPRPVLLKIAPDLTWPELDDVLDVAATSDISGILATNTTTARAGLPPRYAHLPGGLSGHPLRQRATEVVRYIATHTEGRLPIIGVGGVFSAAEVWEKLEAGASLVQAYTGFIYQGPTFAFDLQCGLLDLLDAHGCRTLAEAFPHLR
ncbi:MAG: quinone-dependent dihydroorotate dehydrogenase [Chloroflexi bacterium]|nr:quinone-dependent dihydroorotate dehydrogenase [Chloroflexota bacterium]